MGGFAFNSLLRLPASLLVCSTLLPVLLLASPSIDVTLEASFPAPPFLLELLETAAAENHSSYLPLLEIIAGGRFSSASTDSELYSDFLGVLQYDGLITDPAALSSFKLALAVHEAAPRIEAHFQFWRSTSQQLAQEDPEAEWSDLEIWREDGRLCADPRCKNAKRPSAKNGTLSTGYHTQRTHQFDRVYGDTATQKIWTLYADITSPDFSRLYEEWQQLYSMTNTPFRIRYKPAKQVSNARLVVSGYGIELALKRTDYIVIDDRQAGEGGKNAHIGAAEVNLEGKDAIDLRPLSSSELLGLGMATSSFIMGSEDPLDTLIKVSQDFPKYAAALALHAASEDFLFEHTSNRELVLPPGFNVIWINGQQINARDVDAFSLLEHLRYERKLIRGVQDIGFSASEAITILSHSAITQAQINPEPQRYDFRDDVEGGNVVVWLNNLEKDTRYATWPEEVNQLLQRTYPGQLPNVRKDIQNIIFPLDFSSHKDVLMVTETLQGLVKRLIAARFGFVPVTSNLVAAEQGKIVYHLNDVYGLSAVVKYLEKCAGERKLTGASKNAFEAAILDRKLRRDRDALTFSEVLASENIDAYITKAQRYLARLGTSGPNAPFFVNGIPIANDDDWLQTLSQRISADLRIIQQGVYEREITQDMWLPGVFLAKASLNRNALIVPEDENDVTLFDVSKLLAEHSEEMERLLPGTTGSNQQPKASLIVIMDMNTEKGANLLIDAIEFVLDRDDVDVALKHQCTFAQASGLTSRGLHDAVAHLRNTRPHLPASRLAEMEKILKNLFLAHMSVEWPGHGKPSPLINALGLSKGDCALLLNGRLIAIPTSVDFAKDDFATFLSYEQKKRIDPAVAAVKDLGLMEKINTPQALARLSSLIALSSVSDIPEGIYDTAPGPRMDAFDSWRDKYTCIKTGSAGEATLQVVASIDPASEVAQRWIPILQVLSQLDGVYMRLFLNPKEMLQELPIKRFYRQVLASQPSFAADGSVNGLTARFEGIPAETLLTTTMDTPPAWLVAPKDSIHDLDNIKLSSMKEQSSLEATYELEHILIEGHTRDTTTKQPPRGVQLVLETEDDPKFADTIVMANVGYFQFKANPGVYNLGLQSGRSHEIFQIDSAGIYKNGGLASGNSTEISLLSFKGATVYPKLSRRAGMESADVLEPPAQLAEGLASRVDDIADNVLAKAGLSGGYLAKGLQYGQKVLSKAGFATGIAVSKRHADINIFSVASGHLYERMLNIMMVSVMRHTKHTVKFWFIEQFLSPSFKSFLPIIAEEYGFEYEMVTYKWPHWLRAQKEKQRVIWGYKILFLDVLFPLDLDKVIFVDADQIVRTDMYELVTHDLEGAPYGFTPMCDSRIEMEGFRFWKQGYWKNFLRGASYHISALYVVDLKRFRQIAAGDRLRQQYHQLSADPNSLSNLDQDLPNHMQMVLPIHSLPQEWLWCETWCSDEALKAARTIDLCNNPLTKEPKLDRARRQVPEWTIYDDEIAMLAERKKNGRDNAEWRLEVAERRTIVEEGEERGVGEEDGKPKTRDEL